MTFSASFLLYSERDNLICPASNIHFLMTYCIRLVKYLGTEYKVALAVYLYMYIYVYILFEQYHTYGCILARL